MHHSVEQINEAEVATLMFRFLITNTFVNFMVVCSNTFDNVWGDLASLPFLYEFQT